MIFFCTIGKKYLVKSSRLSVPMRACFKSKTTGRVSTKFHINLMLMPINNNSNTKITVSQNWYKYCNRGKDLSPVNDTKSTAEVCELQQ